MNLIVQKTNSLQGTVTIPGSKSQTIRGLLIATLAKGTSHLRNALDADDTRTAIEACKKLGAKIQVKGTTIKISSNGLPLKTKASLINPALSSGRKSFSGRKCWINTGNSGITTRFVMPALGLREDSEQKIVLDCGPQMRARPVLSLVNALTNLGMSISGKGKSGSLPKEISGKLIGGNTSVDGITSQYISALLMSLPCAEKDSIITVNDLHERPYVDMTLAWLKEQKIRFSHKKLQKKDVFHVYGKQTYRAFKKNISGDFSSASYFLAAGCLLPGQIVIKGLNLQDPQGDKELISILKKMGVEIIVSQNSIKLYGGRPLKGIKIDANKIPDLVPTLAVLGTQAEGKTEIVNVAQARLKETDRLNSMTEGLTKMGARVIEKKDGMVVYKSQLSGAKVKGYEDHRTIMALSLAGMLASGRTIVTTAQGINKTFPEYMGLMKSLGAKLTSSI